MAVDDEPSSLKYITKCIAEIPILNLIHSTCDAISALEFIKNNEIDLLITDLNMPILSGIEFNEIIKDRCKTIFITGYSDLALQAMGRNAVEILNKPLSFEQFEAAILKAFKIIEFDKRKSDEVKLNNQFALLTEAEKKIIIDIGKGITNNEIANGNYISIKTIDSHKANIKQKLGFKNSTELLFFSYQISNFN